MTNAEIKAMLAENTNMTERDIDRHMADGIMVYESFEEFKTECLAGLIDEEEITDMWKKLDEMTTAEGKTVKVDFVL